MQARIVDKDKDRALDRARAQIHELKLQLSPDGPAGPGCGEEGGEGGGGGGGGGRGGGGGGGAGLVEKTGGGPEDEIDARAGWVGVF
jgi:hypothetical protein